MLKEATGYHVVFGMKENVHITGTINPKPN
jgi:hypothetical protein